VQYCAIFLQQKYVGRFFFQQVSYCGVLLLPPDCTAFSEFFAWAHAAWGKQQSKDPTEVA